MKCPACSTTVPDNTAKCPVCGYAFAAVGGVGVGGGGPGVGGAAGGRGGLGAGIPTRPRNSSLAVASLAMGVASWVGFSLLASVPAVITGHMAQKEIREAGGAIGGGGLATAGLVAGYLNIALSIIFFGALMSMLSSVFQL